MQCEECEPGIRVAVFKRSPKQPTPDEKLAHDACHVPFRSWCPHCVAAAAKATPHRKGSDEDNAVACHHLDYWFMRDQKGSESVPVVIVKDDDTKAVGAHVVAVKGAVDWVAERVCEDIKNFGHCGTVSLKSDQESALKDLVHEVQLIRGRQKLETLIEESKVYDSQSNGIAERAVQSVETITRTHKLALEKKLGVVIPSKHPIMTWLVEHAADMLNKYQVRSDGRTSYERIRVKPYKGEMIEFGRMVFHMYPGKHSGGSMKERWGSGIFLGK